MAARPYAVTPAFERAVITLSCTSTTFYGKVGHALEPDALGDPVSKLLLQAAQALAKELGRGPGSGMAVLQRIRRWMADGKVTYDQLQEAMDTIEIGEDARPDEKTVLNEIVPTIKKRMHRETVEVVTSEFANRGDMKKVVELVERADRLGVVDSVSTGIKLTSESLGIIETIKLLDRLATGISQLDDVIEGGLWRGALGMFIGGAGDGKSMALSHTSSTAYMNGLFVGYATLELPEPIVLARVTSAATGVPINEVMNGSLDRARQRLDALSKKQALGTFLVREFPAQVTTFDDVRDWVDRSEDQEKRQMDLLVVDYADKLGVKNKQEASYKVGLEVFEAMRLYVQTRQKWGWTASQSRRKGDKKKSTKDLDDVADSMHKVRVADVVITLNAEEDPDGNRQMSYFVAKNRVGESRRMVGPLPVDFACGRMTP